MSTTTTISISHKWCDRDYEILANVLKNSVDWACNMIKTLQTSPNGAYFLPSLREIVIKYSTHVGGRDSKRSQPSGQPEMPSAKHKPEPIEIDDTMEHVDQELFVNVITSQPMINQFVRTLRTDIGIQKLSQTTLDNLSAINASMRFVASLGTIDPVIVGQHVMEWIPASMHIYVLSAAQDVPGPWEFTNRALDVCYSDVGKMIFNTYSSYITSDNDLDADAVAVFKYAQRLISNYYYANTNERYEFFELNKLARFALEWILAHNRIKQIITHLNIDIFKDHYEPRNVNHPLSDGITKLLSGLETMNFMPSLAKSWGVDVIIKALLCDNYELIPKILKHNETIDMKTLVDAHFVDIVQLVGKGDMKNEMFARLLKYSPDIATRYDANGLALIHYATTAPKSSILKTLLETHPDLVNLPTKDDRNALPIHVLVNSDMAPNQTFIKRLIILAQRTTNINAIVHIQGGNMTLYNMALHSYNKDDILSYLYQYRPTATTIKNLPGYQQDYAGADEDNSEDAIEEEIEKKKIKEGLKGGVKDRIKDEKEKKPKDKIKTEIMTNARATLPRRAKIVPIVPNDPSVRPLRSAAQASRQITSSMLSRK